MKSKVIGERRPQDLKNDSISHSALISGFSVVDVDCRDYHFMGLYVRAISITA